MEKINLQELYSLQEELDLDIASKHGVTYKSTHEKRLLALIIEIGELANETRCFKYWSNKGPSPKEVVIEEYADGLHFLLSLGIPLKVSKKEYELLDESVDLTSLFHKMYRKSTILVDHYDEEHYIDAFQTYLNIAKKLGFTSEDIISSYKDKLAINYNRQKTNY